MLAMATLVTATADTASVAMAATLASAPPSSLRRLFTIPPSITGIPVADADSRYANSSVTAPPEMREDRNRLLSERYLGVLPILGRCEPLKIDFELGRSRRLRRSSHWGFRLMFESGAPVLFGASYGTSRSAEWVLSGDGLFRN